MRVESVLGLSLLAGSAFAAPVAEPIDVATAPRLLPPYASTYSVTYQRGNAAVTIPFKDGSGEETHWEIDYCAGAKCNIFKSPKMTVPSTSKSTFDKKYSATIYVPINQVYNFRLRACNGPNNCGSYATIVPTKLLKP